MIEVVGILTDLIEDYRKTKARLNREYAVYAQQVRELNEIIEQNNRLQSQIYPNAGKQKIIAKIELESPYYDDSNPVAALLSKYKNIKSQAKMIEKENNVIDGKIAVAKKENITLQQVASKPVSSHRPTPITPSSSIGGPPGAVSTGLFGNLSSSSLNQALVEKLKNDENLKDFYENNKKYFAPDIYSNIKNFLDTQENNIMTNPNFKFDENDEKSLYILYSNTYNILLHYFEITPDMLLNEIPDCQRIITSNNMQNIYHYNDRLSTNKDVNLNKCYTKYINLLGLKNYFPNFKHKTTIQRPFEFISDIIPKYSEYRFLYYENKKNNYNTFYRIVKDLSTKIYTNVLKGNKPKTWTDTLINIDEGQNGYELRVFINLFNEHLYSGDPNQIKIYKKELGEENGKIIDSYIEYLQMAKKIGVLPPILPEKLENYEIDIRKNQELNNFYNQEYIKKIFDSNNVYNGIAEIIKMYENPNNQASQNKVLLDSIYMNIYEILEIYFAHVINTLVDDLGDDTCSDIIEQNMENIYKYFTDQNLLKDIDKHVCYTKYINLLGLKGYFPKFNFYEGNEQRPFELVVPYQLLKFRSPRYLVGKDNGLVKYTDIQKIIVKKFKQFNTPQNITNINDYFDQVNKDLYSDDANIKLEIYKTDLTDEEKKQLELYKEYLQFAKKLNVDILKKQPEPAPAPAPAPAPTPTPTTTPTTTTTTTATATATTTPTPTTTTSATILNPFSFIFGLANQKPTNRPFQFINPLNLDPTLSATTPAPTSPSPSPSPSTSSSSSKGSTMTTTTTVTTPFPQKYFDLPSFSFYESTEKTDDDVDAIKAFMGTTDVNFRNIYYHKKILDFLNDKNEKNTDIYKPIVFDIINNNTEMNDLTGKGLKKKDIYENLYILLEKFYEYVYDKISEGIQYHTTMIQSKRMRNLYFICKLMSEKGTHIIFENTDKVNLYEICYTKYINRLNALGYFPSFDDNDLTYYQKPFEKILNVNIEDKDDLSFIPYIKEDKYYLFSRYNVKVLFQKIINKKTYGITNVSGINENLDPNVINKFVGEFQGDDKMIILAYKNFLSDILKVTINFRGYT